MDVRDTCILFPPSSNPNILHIILLPKRFFLSQYHQQESPSSALSKILLNLLWFKSFLRLLALVMQVVCYELDWLSCASRVTSASVWNVAQLNHQGESRATTILVFGTVFDVACTPSRYGPIPGCIIPKTTSKDGWKVLESKPYWNR